MQTKITGLESQLQGARERHQQPRHPWQPDQRLPTATKRRPLPARLRLPRQRPHPSQRRLRGKQGIPRLARQLGQSERFDFKPTTNQSRTNETREPGGVF